MAGLQEFDKKAAKLVRKICAPAGCVYATADDTCAVKYSDEIVDDFAKDGCMSAAILAPGENPINATQDHASVIPVQILSYGSVTHAEVYKKQTDPLTRYEHRINLVFDSEGNKIFKP